MSHIYNVFLSLNLLLFSCQINRLDERGEREHALKTVLAAYTQERERHHEHPLPLALPKGYVRIKKRVQSVYYEAISKLETKGGSITYYFLIYIGNTGGQEQRCSASQRKCLWCTGNDIRNRKKCHIGHVSSTLFVMVIFFSCCTFICFL